MYSVSNDYLEKITSSSREVSWYGSIKLSSGTVVPFDTSNIASGGLSVNYDVSSDENPSIGNAFAGELKLNLYTDIDRYSLYGAEVTAYFRLYLTENTYEDVPLGVFYITEAERTTNMVSIVAYDGMTKLDSVKVAEDKSGSYPYEWIKAVVERGGLQLGNTSAEIGSMPNGNEQITFTQNSEPITSMSCRDALGYLSAVVCANAFIGRDGKVYIKGYDDAEVATIGADGRFSSSIADYTTRYTAISLTISSTNATEYYAESTDDGLTFALGTNPFLQNGSSAEHETVCRDILNGLSVIEYVPFSIGLPVRPELDIMDAIMLTGNQATSSIGAITSLDFSSSGSMNVECTGSNPRLMGVKTKAEKAIDQIQNTVAKEINQMSVVQNSSSVTCGESTETSILTYNFEVTQEENTTMVDVSVVMTSNASETEVGDVYTLSDIVAHLSFYVDGSEVSVYSPEFIVDEGKDTMTFNYSLSGLSVGAHEFDIRLTVDGGSGSIAAGDVHEMLWGYGITFEVYVKSLVMQKLPSRTVFYAGQSLDYSGAQVDAVYNNGLHNNVTDQSTFDPAEETPLTQEDLGTITVSVNATVDDTDLATSFDVMVKDGSWKGCAIYPGFRPYDNMWDWVKIADFTKGSISVAYPGVAGLNDEDVVSYSRGWGSDSQSSQARFTGNGISGAGSFSLAPSGKVEQYFFSPCLGGSAYWWIDSDKTVFARVDGDSKNGQISNQLIGQVAAGNFKAYNLYNSGVLVPMYDATTGMYGKVYVLNTSDGTVTLMHTFETTGSLKCEGLVLDDGSEYHFVHPGSGSSAEKYLIRYKDGVLSGHSFSIAGYYDYAAMYYDADEDVLVLYLGNKTYASSTITYATKCYKIDRYDYSVTEVTLPTSLIITNMDTSEDSSHVGYDTAEAVVLLNGTTTGQSEHSRYVYNGRICVGNPVTQYNYGYFDAYNGKRTPQQFLMLEGWNGYGYYSANYKRIAYIDNLYFEESENNRIFLNVYHGL